MFSCSIKFVILAEEKYSYVLSSFSISLLPRLSLFRRPNRRLKILLPFSFCSLRFLSSSFSTIATFSMSTLLPWRVGREKRKKCWSMNLAVGEDRSASDDESAICWILDFAKIKN